MRLLPRRILRSRDLRPRTPFERRLRVAEFVVLGMWIFGAAAIFVLSFRYEGSVLRAEEAEVTRKQDLFVVCRASEQYTLDRGVPPESFDDLIQFKYVWTVPVDPITHDKLSVPSCVGGPEEYMDPVQTIPGFRHLYSYSPAESGSRPHSEE